MDPARFDRLAISLASHPVTRRRMLAAGAGLLGGLVSVVRGTHAQGATPTASPAASVPPKLAANNGTLFVQTAAGGTFAPNPVAGQPLASSASATLAAGATPVAAQHGAYVLTLRGHTGGTIGFSDRPARDFGEVPTSRFFTGLGFFPNNPPNAALVMDTPEQQGAVVLVELLDPRYDPSNQTLTYEANLLHQYPNAKGEVLASLAAKAERTPPASFTNVSLFIDDCPDSVESCWVAPTGGQCGYRGQISSGNCWNWTYWTCNPCGSYSSQCNASQPNCNGGCLDDIALCGGPGCCNGQCCLTPSCIEDPQPFYCQSSSICDQTC